MKFGDMTPEQLTELWPKLYHVGSKRAAMLSLDGTVWTVEADPSAQTVSMPKITGTPELTREIDGPPMIDVKLGLRLFVRKELHKRRRQRAHPGYWVDIRVVYAEQEPKP